MGFSIIKYYQNQIFTDYSFVWNIKNSYLFVLIAYSIFSGIAFFNSGNIKKSNLLTAMCCAVPALIFLAVRNYFYLKAGFWNTRHLFIWAFFWAEISLFVYAEFCLIVLIRSLNRIDYFRKTITAHMHFRPTEQKE